MKFQVFLLTFILFLGKTISVSVVSGVGTSGICCINNQCYTNCNGISCVDNKCTSSNGEPLVPATPEQIQQAQQQANEALNAVLPIVNQTVGNIFKGVNTLVGGISQGVSKIGPFISNLVNSIFNKF